MRVRTLDSEVDPKRVSMVGSGVSMVGSEVHSKRVGWEVDIDCASTRRSRRTVK